jgi:outer membrane protein OmpA-like peptidoglycan-associated protein
MKTKSEVQFMRRIKQIGFGILSVVLLSSPAWAAENAQFIGSLAMPLTQEGGTARAMSMGSAVVAVPQGSASLFWNPAALGEFGDCGELGLHHNSGLGDSFQETAVVGMPLGSLGGFAASLNYVNNGTFEGRDSAGNQVDNYTAGDLGASLGWGREFFPGVFAGAAVKFNRQTLASQSYDALAADLGLLWNPVSRLNLGLTYSNLNLGPEVGGSSLDAGWRAGASYGVNEALILAASSALNYDGFADLEMGVEWYVHPILALRAGYVYNITDSQLTGLTGMTAGLGIKIIKNLIVDYAYLPYGELGASHRLSLTYNFCCPQKAATPEPKTEAKPEPIIQPNVMVLEKLIVLDDTHFTFDTSTLTPEGAKVVLENTQILKDNPDVKIRIAGYASASGTEEYNQKLSERRAKAVEELLIKQGGIAPDRLTTIGYGDTRPAVYEPIPKNINSAAAHANMRVLFEIVVK